MARADLRGLIGNLGDTEAPARPVAGLQAEPSGGVVLAPVEQASPPPPAAPKEIRPARSAVPATPRLAASQAYRFSDFERKETRLRADQQDALTEHARRLNRAKGVGGQRITDNTLIRVAVDLLLSKTDKLAGLDEAELRRSVGLKGSER